MMLSNRGYQVIRAHNGSEALALFEPHQPEIDILLLDLVMPKPGRRVVFDGINRNTPGIPTIFCSGYAQDPADCVFLDSGRFGLLKQPFTAEVLSAALTEVVKAN